MNELIKKTITMNILIAAVLSLGGPASASEFNLSSVSADNLRGIEFKAMPVPLPRVPKAALDELMEMNLSIRIPFKAINKAMLLEDQLSIINLAAPVLQRYGDLLQVFNIRLKINGITMEPVITLKPYFEAKNKIAIRIQRVQLHAAGAPTPGSSGIPVAVPAPDTGSDFNTEEMVAGVVGLLTGSITDALNEKLIASQSPLRAADIIVFEYNKTDWTLHVGVSASAIKHYVSKTLFDSKKLFKDIYMTGFSFTDSAIVIELATEN